MKNKKTLKRIRRKSRVRATISGNASQPRLSVYRSNKHIYAQLIDDEKGKTLASASDADVSEKSAPKEKDEVKRSRRLSCGYQVGKILAERASAQKVGKVVFDRSGFAYKGIVRALAEGARDGGLIF